MIKDYINKFSTEAINNIEMLLALVTEEKESNEVSILAENKLVEAKSRLMLNRVAGIYNLYTYFRDRNKDDGCHVVDEKKRKSIVSKVKKIKNAKNIWFCKHQQQ